MKQTTFDLLTFDAKKKRTRREVFLAQMEQVISCGALDAIIEPHYPKAGRRGRPPKPLDTMLRIHFMQQWCALSDPGMEDALYEIESMRRFARLDLGDDALPDETTILKFRRLLQTHGLAGKLLEAVNAYLEYQTGQSQSHASWGAKRRHALRGIFEGGGAGEGGAPVPSHQTNSSSATRRCAVAVWRRTPGRC